MEANNSQLIKISAINGVILGIALVIYSVILFLLDIMPTGFLKPFFLLLLSLAIFIVGLVLAVKNVRNSLFKSEGLTYGQAFLIGTIIVIVAALISSIYSYIQSAIIDPGYMTRVLNAQKDWLIQFMQDKNVPADKIDDAVSKLDERLQNINPLGSAIRSFIGFSIFGTIVSLIVAAALKKKINPFGDQ